MPDRRQTLALLAAFPALTLPASAFASRHDFWDLPTLRDALADDLARLVDIRRPEEWRETGVAQGAWPIDMTDPRFRRRLFAARQLAGGRPVALICRTGRRSGLVMDEIRRAREPGFVDAAGGMAGNGSEPGWIARGYPIIAAAAALAALPAELA